MFRFYIANARYDAFLVADRLNQAGIKAHVFNQHAQSIVGDVPPDVAQPHRRHKSIPPTRPTSSEPPQAR